MRRVLLIQEILPHYRVPFFKGLIAECLKNGILLIVVHGRERPGDSPKSVGPGVLPQGNEIWISQQLLIWKVTVQPVNFLKNYDLIIVEFALRHALNLLLIIMRATGETKSKLAYWGHSHNPRSRRGFIEWTKRQIRRSVDHWFAYTEGVARDLTEIHPSKVTIVNNAIDTQQLRENILAVSHSEPKERYRCLILGSLRPDKNLRYLVSEIDPLVINDPRISIDIVGDGPDLGILLKWTKSRPSRIRYHGHLEGKNLAPILWRSTIILNPGLVGLVVLDSFVGEAPIITTTNNGIHSPEFSYIANGNNGMVVDCMPGEYNKAVKRVMDDDEFLRKLRTGCAASAEIYTIEKMVGNFTAGIIKATS